MLRENPNSHQLGRTTIRMRGMRKNMDRNRGNQSTMERTPSKDWIKKLKKHRHHRPPVRKYPEKPYTIRQFEKEDSARNDPERYAPLLRKKVQCYNKDMDMLVDPGANGNYISKDMVKKHKIPTRRLKEPYDTSLAKKGSDGGEITRETIPIPLLINDHIEEIILDVAPIEDDILLGQGWMYKHNPPIDWRTHEITFSRCDCPRKKEKKYEICSFKQLKRWAKKGKTLIQTAFCRKRPDNLYDE